MASPQISHDQAPNSRALHEGRVLLQPRKRVLSWSTRPPFSRRSRRGGAIEEIFRYNDATTDDPPLKRSFSMPPRPTPARTSMQRMSRTRLKTPKSSPWPSTTSRPGQHSRGRDCKPFATCSPLSPSSSWRSGGSIIFPRSPTISIVSHRCCFQWLSVRRHEQRRFPVVCGPRGVVASPYNKDVLGQPLSSPGPPTTTPTDRRCRTATPITGVVRLAGRSRSHNFGKKVQVI